jgi:hypothetical protein
MNALSRRRFLAAGGGTLGLSVAAGAAGASPAGSNTLASTTLDPMDRSFTNQSAVSNISGAVLLSKGAQPAPGRVWEVQRVFWNVNAEGNVAANGIQTYLYRLPASDTTAQAETHMGSSLDGWLGCCGNSGLTGNGDMRFDANDVVIRPGQMLWMYFIVPAEYNGYALAAGMSVWELRA